MSIFVKPQSKEFSPADWQAEDIEYIWPKDLSANWSEMGVYKTTTLLWVIEEKLRHIRYPKVLILTTKSGKGTYYKHVPALLPGWQIISVDTQKCYIVWNGKEHPIDPIEINPQAPTIVLGHYQVMTKRKLRPRSEAEREWIERRSANPPKALSPVGQLIKDTKWDFIALDEAHRIKNFKTSWSEQIYKLKAPYRHVMTGTGFINRPDEIWGLLHFLDRKRFSSYWKFREEYVDELIVGGFRKIIGIRPEKQQEFRELVREFGPRRTKNEVFKDLPHPIPAVRDVELNPTQKRMYEEIKQNLYTLDQAGEPLQSPNVLSQLNRLRQICVATPRVTRDYFDEKAQRRMTEVELTEPSSKLDALMDVIDELEWDDERRDQLVVFSNYRDPIELAKKRFDKKGITYLHMDQKHSDQERYQLWDIEFPKKNHQVFICTLQLGSESISLTSASTCVFLDQSWSPKDNEQGISRVWRPGQEKAALIIRMHAKGTVDDRIYDTNKMKLGWFNAIFGPEEIKELENEAVMDALSFAGILDAE